MFDYATNLNRGLNKIVSRALKRLALICLVPTSLIQLALAPGANAAATFTPLGLFDRPFNRAYDISADGSVVVGTRIDPATDRLRLYRWTAAGTTFGPFSSDTAAVSSDGRIVGSATPFIEVPPTGPFALRWESVSDAGITLGSLPGKTNSVALDLSADGAVVVGSSSTFAGDPEAFRWTEATGMVGLGGLSGSEVWSIANGVSADGAVVVGQAKLAGTDHAFRWTAETGMVRLERPNSTFAAATGVSPNGSVVVGIMRLDPPPGPPGDTQFVAFRWTEAEGMVSLGKLPGGSGRGTAFDASLDGSVIVGVDDQEAFYWSSTLGMVNLKDLLIANGATGLDGWLLTEANAVSYDGQTVIGTGIHNGVTQAFVATIPEPSTNILAIIAAAALFACYFLRARRMLTTN